MAIIHHRNILYKHHPEYQSVISVSTVSKENMDSSNAPFTCPVCGNLYSSQRNVNRHRRSVHQGQRFSCEKCSKSFASNQKLNKHKCAACSQHRLSEYRCSKCPEVFPSPRDLAVHFRRCHSSGATQTSRHDARPSTSRTVPVSGGTTSTNQPTPSTSSGQVARVGNSRAIGAPSSSRIAASDGCTTCRTCHRRFEDRLSLYRHQMIEGHRVLPSQSGGSMDTDAVGSELQPRPWGEGPAPWVEESTGKVTEPGLQEAYDLDAPYILARDQPGEVFSTYNLPVNNNFSIGELMERAREIYQSLSYSFRFNLAFGVILRHVETGRYRYFHPYAVDPLFTTPLYITELRDLERLRQRLESLDVMSYLLKQRPDTKWKPVLITNVQFYAYRMNFPLGHPPVALPDYLKHHKAIIALDYNKFTKRFYDDHLCAFRCLALHRDPSARQSLEKPTKALYYQWVAYTRDHHLQSLYQVRPEEYAGLPPSLLCHFEACFRVNVSVFTLDVTGIAQPVYKSRGLYQEHMYLNQFENHLSLITNMNIYCKRYQCPTCERLFRRKIKCNEHQRRCTAQTTLRFPGGFHHTPKTVFDELEEFDFVVEPRDRYFPWFVVFDFECFLKPMNTGTQKLRWTQEHHPISVSVCSNVEGFTSPHCIVDSDPDRLIAAMLSYMTEIGEAVNELSKEKYKGVLERLREWMQLLSDEDQATVDDDDDDDDDDDVDDVNVRKGDNHPAKGKSTRAHSTPLAKWRKHVSDLCGKLLGYCSQVPVLGFNSARYDLNIIKEKLPKHLSLDDVESQAFTVKKNNAYLCQSNQSFKFLDVTQYLSPGTSYAQFLKAFGVQEKKGFFPYEYLDTPDKLNETRLPPLGEAWYSSLKQKSVLDDGVKSIEENYAELEEVWRREGMSTFRDFLEWYNNLDVGPFVEAVRAMQRFYFEDGIDLFKTTMSVPGVARQKLFRESRKLGVSFALFDKRNEDLYHTVKGNVVGGPSIIFTRYHKADQTLIRGHPEKRCKRVVGYDANALYLWAIDQPMPTGPFVRRRAENRFKPERRDRYACMYDWMDWLREQEGRDIRHKLNWGREKRVGPYLVDGFIPGSMTVFEFHGCYFHGHHCHLTTKARAQEKSRERLEQKLKATRARAAYIRDLGYTVVEMWECNFRAECKTNSQLSSFIRDRQPPFTQKKAWKKVSERDMLNAVEKGELFGMVEVDIRVPDHWMPGQNPHGTRLSPKEYFQEMTPLFCNAEVPFEIIGEHMQGYIRENDLSTKPRRMLVGGLKARKILIATPLLQWYLQHGMVVDRVYQVVEYTPNACFQQFVRDVCSARREADRDPSAAIRGDTAKLTGNSAYGSVLINKEKHQTVSYVCGQTAASTQVNFPQFRKLTELGDEYFEVEKAKKVIRLDTPVQLGYFILQYAKLRMLQFYYDFMDVYVDRSDFEYMEMDTDSAYMALSAKCLSDVIKPTKQSAYQDQLKGLCGDHNPDDSHVTRWFPRSCCSVHALHDKRTPGLFKLEYEGDEMIGLCSKTYLVSQSSLQRTPKPTPSSSVRTAQRLLRRARRRLGRNKPVNNKARRLRSNTPVVGHFERREKFSCKGISKRTLKTPLRAFRDVLRTRVPGEGLNRGFRLKGNTMCSYQQSRQGLSYLYCKRRVLADGIHTAPLDLELCPWPSRDDRLDDTDTFLAELLENLAEN
ncbi:uncharacterized protein LOC124129020 [Haliotis rufescens]|uniref:uncharacterized protein LOC124129020 n=1 Tax=Haliotis rufescens TaxID=6454 RepID=UPI00201F3BF2|nr:uncharacterized protein LOC124129020 [Haliotis rufescens]